MRVRELFSRRQSKLKGDAPEVYAYDMLPDQLRAQIVHIITDAFGEDRWGRLGESHELYEAVHQVLCREFGVFSLVRANGDKEAVLNFVLQSEAVEKVLDVVEVCFHAMQAAIAGSRYADSVDTKISPDDAVAELNYRFRQHAVGYQFESGEIIRVDSEFLHAEAVKPTLKLLRDHAFDGANEEFLKAHEHYRHGNNKECLVEALKAFESTMKTICDLRGWQINPNDTAKKLIAACLRNGLLPEFSESQLMQVATLLESGVPTVRNKQGGHGQGVAPTAVSNHTARYGLNLTATTILYLIEANEALS